MTTPHSNTPEFSSVTNEELESQLEALQTQQADLGDQVEDLQVQIDLIETELENRRMAGIREVLPRLETLSDEELLEVEKHVTQIMSKRFKKRLNEMTLKEVQDLSKTDLNSKEMALCTKRMMDLTLEIFNPFPNQ